MPVIVFAGPMELTQCALEVLNLALVVDLLAFGQFQRFQHLFHFLEGMFQFLNDTVDLINSLGNRRLFVLLLRRLGMLASLGTFMAFRPLGAFGSFGGFITLRVLNRLAVFRMFGMLLGRVLHRFRRVFMRRFPVFGVRGCGSIAGRGQGTAGFAVSAAAGMASASASGSTPGTRCCRIRLLG
jgi:hypothetical protein